MPLGVSLSEGLGSNGWTLKARAGRWAATMPRPMLCDKLKVGELRRWAIPLPRQMTKQRHGS